MQTQIERFDMTENEKMEAFLARIDRGEKIEAEIGRAHV